MTPHKSTTHEERFYHFTAGLRGFNGGTVFARKEGDNWFVSTSLCHYLDQFQRRRGRTQARRRYFQKPTSRQLYGQEPPSKDGAFNVILDCAAKVRL